MRYFCFLFCLFVSGVSMAQQDPLFSSDGQRSFLFNPASTGTLNKYSVNTIGRRHLYGINNASNSFQLNGAFKFLSFPDKWKGLGEGALGVNYLYDQKGFQKSNTVVVHSNFQFKLGRTFLSVGVSPGVHIISFDGEWIPPTSIPDPSLPNNTYQEAAFTMGAGIHWYGRKFSLGFASSHLFEEVFEDLSFESRRHYYFNGSYKFPISRVFGLRAVSTLRTTGSTTSFEGMLYSVLTKNEISLGLGYRNGDALLAGFSFRFSSFYVGYFIDYNQSQLTNSTFSHEVRLAFEIKDLNLYPFSPVGTPAF